MSAEKPFEGDFLFVNHDATRMKASVHTRKVFSHVQTKYRKWKRTEDNRALRASITMSLCESQPADGPRAATRQKARTNIPPFPIRRSPVTEDRKAEHQPRRITIRSLISDDASNVASPSTAITRVLPAQLQSPDTILKEGNSDPFNAYPVKIDAAANEMLSFYRDSVLPAIYNIGKHKSMTSASVRRDWHFSIYGWGASDGLGDEGAGTALISTCATVIGSISRNLTVQNQANQFRSKSMTVLRSRLATGDCSRSQIYWHIKLILDAEVFHGNRVGAVGHLNMLRQFFERNGDMLDIGLLLHAVYHDIHISCMFLSRPVFDVERWLPEKTKPLVEAVRPYLPDFSDIRNRYLDPSIDNPKLRALFIERRESLAVWLARTGSDEESKNSLAIVSWLQVRVYLHQGRLVNLFLQADAKYKAGLPPQLRNTLACQGYISLATLLYIRSISFNATVHGLRLFDATSILLANMQEMLECSEEPESSNYEKYENARFWTLYVGACTEMFRGMAPEANGWFTRHFAQKAVKLGLDGQDAWDDTRVVLKGFLYTDLMHPNGREWFHKVMGTAKQSNNGLEK